MAQKRNITLRIDIVPPWPNCSPSTYFCGPEPFVASKTIHVLSQLSKMRKSEKMSEKIFCFADIVGNSQLSNYE